MILPNDIIKRTTSDGVTVWVSQRLIMECCGIVDEYLRLSRTRYKQSLPASWQKAADAADFLLGDTGKAWRWGRRAGQYYYDYDRIPDRAPACYRSKLPAREDLTAFVEDQNLSASRERRAAMRNVLTAAVAELEDNTDARWIQTQSGYQIDLPVCRDYARALAWCRFITRVVREGRTSDYGAATVGAFYDTCAAILSELRLSNFRVTTAASLRKKLIGFPTEVEDQRRWIISAKIGNNNRQIVGKYPIIDTETGEILQFDLHQAIMYSAYMNIGGSEKEHLQTLYDDLYTPAMNDFQLLPIAYSTFCNHLTRLSVRLKADMERHGEDYYRKHMQTYIPTERLTYAHSLFAGDGSGLMAYRYEYSGRDRKTGKKVYETRVMNLYAILVSDVASGYIAGYGIAPEGDHKETQEMLQDAVRMAVQNGGNQTIFEFVSDNHPAFSSSQSQEFLRRAFNRVRRIKPMNSQANPAETQFRLFKNSTLRSLSNFIRTSHNAGVENRANVDNKSKFDYPTYAEAVAQLAERIEVWNNKPRTNGKTPAEMFAKKHPECQPLDAVTLRGINGRTTELSVERMRGFVAPEKNNEVFRYEIPDYAGTGADIISQATGNRYDSKVICVYDETGADLYSLDGRFIMSCPPAGKAKMAYIETTPETAAARRHLDARKTAQLETAAQFVHDVEVTTRYLAANGYDAAVQLGAHKEDVNGQYEEVINVTIKDKKAADRARRNLERKETKRAEKEAAEAAKSTRERYMNRLRQKMQQIKQQ